MIPSASVHLKKSIAQPQDILKSMSLMMLTPQPLASNIVRLMMTATSGLSSQLEERQPAVFSLSVLPRQSVQTNSPVHQVTLLDSNHG